MEKDRVGIVVVLMLLTAMAVPGTPAQAQAGKAAYPAMAPVEQYLMADRNAEVALARSGAPASVADAADVMVLGRQGYTTAAKGTNGFLCVVERGWGAATDAAEFWNPRIRSPICFNPAAARTFAQIYLMKTRLVLAGKSKAEILAETSAALDKKQLPALEPGSMCYMMSKQQYLNDRDVHWHPHVMIFVGGDAEMGWGANVEGSPVIAANDPEERVTIMMVPVWKWSDGTPGPELGH